MRIMLEGILKTLPGRMKVHIGRECSAMVMTVDGGILTSHTAISFPECGCGPCIDCKHYTSMIRLELDTEEEFILDDVINRIRYREAQFAHIL